MGTSDKPDPMPPGDVPPRTERFGCDFIIADGEELLVVCDMFVLRMKEPPKPRAPGKPRREPRR
jgi:hypothetical protein